MKITRKRTRRGAGYLDGQFLIAMPNMPDERFARSVIYMCAHSEEGAMGIIINHRAKDLRFHDLLVQLDIVKSEDAIRLPRRASAINVLRGGPVETGRGFVLHSADYFIDTATLPIDDGICLTHTVDILKAIARGEGPNRALLALGYAGWGAGQLETEIQRNDWLHCPATSDIIFDTGLETKYERVFEVIGIDPAKLSSQAGHA
jgi:putative transcriptional regulator